MKFLLRFLFTLTFIGVLAVGSYLTIEDFIWKDFSETKIEEKYKNSQIDLTNSSNDVEATVKNRPFTVLLLGVDSSNMDELSRTDTMILAVVNPDEGEVSLLSIPRDTRTLISGRNTYDKINSAYAYGGIDMTLNTVENLLDIPIDFYSIVNFDGVVNTVDLIGGLELDVEKDMYFHDRISDSYVSLYKGQQLLNGTETLNYARFRKDGEGDFGRMRRQQQVIREFVNQTVSFRNITKMVDIFNTLGDNIKTNLSFKDMVKIIIKMHDVRGDSISSISMKGHPDMVNGVSYVIINEDTLENTRTDLKNLLESDLE